MIEFTEKDIWLSQRYLNEDSVKLNKSNYNLEAKFDYWNKKAFDGQLPKVDLKWNRSKKIMGVCKAWISGSDNTMGGHTIEISNAWDRTEERFDAVLVHEMTHLFFVWFVF